MPNVMTTKDESGAIWQLLPDSILLQIFSFLPTHMLLTSSRVCKAWHRVANDNYLWKDLFYRTWQIDVGIPMAPGKTSWQGEFKRLYFHTPQIESEVLKDHRDQVLHISFAHNGEMFATSSKDGYVKVWTASYPTRVRYYADMREFTWKYTQFSQFNETDTLLLVSGVHFGAHSTSGEIAVFNLVGGFELQCRVLNKPYDIFGTWYNESYLLSGNLHWLGHLTSCSVLWLNKVSLTSQSHDPEVKASQALESESESVVMRLYKFRNINASSIRTIMIAKCHEDESKSTEMGVSTEGPWSQLSGVREDRSIMGADTSQSECSQGKAKRRENRIKLAQKVQVLEDGDRGVCLLEVDEDSNGVSDTIEYSSDYRKAETKTCGPDGAMAQGHCSDDDVREVKDETLPTDIDMGDVEGHTSDDSDESAGCREKWRCDDSHSRSSAQPLRHLKQKVESCRFSFSPGSDRPSTSSQVVPGVENAQSAWCPHHEDSFHRSGGDINVNTNSTGNNNTNPYSVMPTAPSTSGRTLAGFAGGDTSRPPMAATVAVSTCQPAPSTSSASRVAEMDLASTGDKYLIFTTGMKTYTPHQIGIKRIKSLETTRSSDVPNDKVHLLPNVADNDYGVSREEFDTVDHLIELHGHIIGMCLSPDHRYLYVNSRPWPQGYEIDDALYPPPIAQEIDIHVIDLGTMHEVGTMHRAHKAYTPNDECFFIFLDVCDEYVASGAEDKHGYLWDRHYGVCLTRFPHTDVVNSVAFNPQDPEILITASDDNSLKIWRSRNRELQVKGHLTRIDQ